MSTLRQGLDDSLALRQAMGFKMHDAHTLLPQFIDFLDRQAATFITTEWAVCWAPCEPAHTSDVRQCSWPHVGIVRSVLLTKRRGN